MMSGKFQEDESSDLSRLAVALDTSDLDTFRQWCGVFGSRVGVLKVGLEAFTSWGPEIVREVVAQSRAAFLDLKLHDIPNTVAGAVASARRLGVRYLTVHASGGRRMLRRAATAAGDDLVILAVTVLTHLSDDELEELGVEGPASKRVDAWARMAREEGCGGVVCSPHEAARLREQHPRPFRLVTPGIRLAGADAQDQRRVATPSMALDAGSDLLVVGRPLTRAADPVAALEAFAGEISGRS